MFNKRLICRSMCIIAFVCQFASIAVASEIRIIEASDISWDALNPARGDASPKAGTLWGDRGKSAATGFLVKFNDGFASPPHAHNTSYRAVVISGLIHNDDPAAAEMWMPAGSFWTQPKGEVHITAAKGQSNVALVEIDAGPYLVIPESEAFDSGERPVNVDVSNIVWMKLAEDDTKKTTPMIAYLSGVFEGAEFNSSFVKIPSGFIGNLESNGTVLNSVVIAGALTYGEELKSRLSPGSYVGFDGASTFAIACNEETIVYIRTNGSFSLSRR